MAEKETEQTYEAFVSKNKNAYFMQSIRWAEVKGNWGREVVFAKDANGEIEGAMLLLIRPVKGFGALVYAPRGPVCDLKDRRVVSVLLKEAMAVCKKHSAFQLKIDPVLMAEDQTGIDALRGFGFAFTPGKPDFTTLQPRGNYVLEGLRGKTQEQVLAGFKQKTRYNIKLARKKGVKCEYGCDDRLLDDYYRIFLVTGKRDGFQVRDKSYYRRLLDCMGPHARLYLCYYEGNAVSGALCIQYADRTYYLFGASDNEYRNVMPNYLMQWEMICWALENGTDIYDFMGIPSSEDPQAPMAGVYRFKQGFCGERQLFAGEFDYNFKPLANWCIESGTALLKVKARVVGRLRRS